MMLMYNKKSGFTIVEIMFSMLFFSILLLAVISTVMQMSNIYAKGVTSKSVSQAGQEISDTIERDFAAVSSIDGALSDYYKPAESGSFGKICLKDSSVGYVWNESGFGRSIPSGTIKAKFNNKDVNLARVSGDVYKAWCEGDGTVSGDKEALNKSSVNMTAKNGEYVELLGNSDSVKLGIDYLTINEVKPSDSNSTSINKGIYNIEFAVGTQEVNAYENNAGEARCKPPLDSGGDWNYCAINRFKFIAITNGGVDD